MNKIMVITTVPNTADTAKSSANLATATVTATATATVTQAITSTVTKAFTKTIPAAARVSSYNTAKIIKVGAPSAVPDHLMTQVMDLIKVTGFNKFSLITAAVQIGLGIAIIHGFKSAWKRLPIQNVPPGERPKRWKEKVRFAYNFLKNAAGENERLRKDIEKARQEVQLAKQNELFAEQYSFGAPMDKQKHSKQENILMANAGTEQQHNEQSDAEEAPLEADPATVGPDQEELLHQLMASDLAQKHMAEQLKQLQESSQHERQDLQSEVARLKSEVLNSHQSNSELRGDLEEAHQHADGLGTLLEYTELKLEEEKEYVVELKELDQAREKEMDKHVEEIAELTKSRDEARQSFKEETTRRERAEKLLNKADLDREKAEHDLFRQAEFELNKYSLAGTGTSEPIPLTTPNVFRFMASRYGINADPPQPTSSAMQTPKVADSSAALSEEPDSSSTPSKKRKRSMKMAKKVDAMSNKRRELSPEEAYGSESDSMEVDPVLPAPDKALGLTNVPRLAPPSTPATAVVPAVTARQASRLPIAAQTPGDRDLRRTNRVNYTEGSRRSAQPQQGSQLPILETPAIGRRRAPSATPAAETTRRVTRSQSPVKRAPAKR
ncbi:hypothetical protein HBI16_010320 [Parastagonospora nodorum]|nr:hypothetical protein HBH52_079240 [Parastagonospora nodorum]KAH5788027.1 hypothetical protein HBI16_010320 [Parastagonospora nodorum]KAH6013419.1 hypothetical protein HBI84_016770 [Parastagonospora nodorum]